jgi:hypothetical protein
MALNIRIDFENRYKSLHLDNDFRFSTFESILVDGTTAKLGIKISKEADQFMPDVYNLAFGPFDNNFQIDDETKLTHQDHSRVFSTIVYAALSFLKANEGKFLGIDGSNTARAYMYYRCIKNNYDYLSSFLNIYGVNYYLRVLQDGSISDDPKDLLLMPKSILRDEQIPGNKLYNYLIFNAK